MGTKYRNYKRGADFFLNEHNMKRICQCCENEYWNGNPIPLEIHHIDGNKKNNSVDNISILCPNCHYFTDNYKSKNRKRCVSKDWFCTKCGRQLYEETKTGLCRNCKNEELKRRSVCNDKDLLQSLMKEYKCYSKVAKVLRVSDKTVAKWCDRFKIKKDGSTS